MSAEKLFDYLSKFNVLLIDVRPRAEFDVGHIMHQRIICVEPTALRDNMSAEMLQEALVLSPDREQSFFAQRNEVDLVVYYDQSSDVSDWGPHRQKMPSQALSALKDALLDYSQEKPLQWPPILLNGGLDAWTDLLGSQALDTSDTINKPRSNALQRRPVPADGQRIDIGKRSHREYNPLNEDELSKWNERARSASVLLDQRPLIDRHEPHENGDDGIVSMPDYEDFAHRYPDVAAVEESKHGRSHLRCLSIQRHIRPLLPLQRRHRTQFNRLRSLQLFQRDRHPPFHVGRTAGSEIDCRQRLLLGRPNWQNISHLASDVYPLLACTTLASLAI